MCPPIRWLRRTLVLALLGCYNAYTSGTGVTSAPLDSPKAATDTTRVTRELGGLRMELFLTPTPRVAGDTATVVVRLENRSADSVRIMVYPCYRMFRGIEYHDVLHEVVCLEGSHEMWLPPHRRQRWCHSGPRRSS